jgi:plasmid stabilization system protein ParE
MVCHGVESLAELPERCPFAPEPGLRQKGVRQLLYGEGRSVYRILYRVKDESVQIITIPHAPRKPIQR